MNLLLLDVITVLLLGVWSDCNVIGFSQEVTSLVVVLHEILY